MSNPEAGRAAGSSAPEGVFQRLFGFLFSSSDPEREKKRLLKEIARSFKRLKTRYYNPKTDIAEPGLAKFLLEFYKVLGPAQPLLSHAQSSNALKAIVVESTLSADQLAVKEGMSEEAIRKRSESAEQGELFEQLKQELKTFFSYFDISRINQINTTYLSLSALLGLVHFDYYFFLKKFDSRLPEGNLTYVPRFEPINARYVSDELKDILEVFAVLDPAGNWDPIMEVLRTYRGTEVIPRDGWKKLLPMIRKIRRSHDLQMLVQLVDKNPFYKPTPRVRKENLVDEYLTKLRMQTEAALQKIVKERRNEKIARLAGQVFGTASVSRLSNYTEKANLLFAKKMLGGYTYVTPLNYLKAFLLDFIKKDVREIMDLLVIPAKWTDSTPSQVLSESFHQLLAISEEITAFDKSLAEDGEIGKKLHVLMYKADRDKPQAHLLRQYLKKINGNAKDMIMRSGQHLVTVGKIIKQALDDYTSRGGALIMNWRELESHTHWSIRDNFTRAYKQLYFFVQLLKALL